MLIDKIITYHHFPTATIIERENCQGNRPSGVRAVDAQTQAQRRAPVLRSENHFFLWYYTLQVHEYRANLQMLY